LGHEVATLTALIPTTLDTNWTIPGGNISVPTVGQFFIETTTTGTPEGEWDLTTTAPSIGSNSTTYGTGPGTGNPTQYNSFALNANNSPDADTFCLVGLGLAPALVGAGLRKRRGEAR